MKFVLLMAEEDHFGRWDRADAELRARVGADFEAFTTAVARRGTLVAGEALASPATAHTVRPGDGRPVTDGPFAETVEQLGGYFVIEAPDQATAVELAGLLPREYSVEVREVLSVGDDG